MTASNHTVLYGIAARMPHADGIRIYATQQLLKHRGTEDTETKETGLCCLRRSRFLCVLSWRSRIGDEYLSGYAANRPERNLLVPDPRGRAIHTLELDRRRTSRVMNRAILGLAAEEESFTRDTFRPRISRRVVGGDAVQWRRAQSPVVQSLAFRVSRLASSF